MNPCWPWRSLTLTPAGTMTASTSRVKVTGSLSVGCTLVLPCLVTRFGPGRTCRCSAASSVCQQRLAHFTRAGNSRTPESAPSLPRAATSTVASSRVSSACMVAKSRSASANGPALHALGEQRGRGDRDRAAAALERHVADPVAVELHEQRQAVAAQRVEALGMAVGSGHRPEIARIAVVVDDHVAVELAQVHQPSTSRARASAATRRSISARVL